MTHQYPWHDPEEREYQRQYKEPREWCLIRSKHYGTKVWAWLDDDRWEKEEDGGLGYFFPSDDDEILDTCVAEFIDDLDWSFLCDRFDDDWTTGWLSPDGKFTPCSNWGHDGIAWLVLHYGGYKDQSDMEEHGWVRLWGAGQDPEFSSERRLSVDQRNWMSRKGFRLEDYD